MQPCGAVPPQVRVNGPLVMGETLPEMLIGLFSGVLDRFTVSDTDIVA